MSSNNDIVLTDINSADNPIQKQPSGKTSDDGSCTCLECLECCNSWIKCCDSICDCIRLFH